MNWRSTNRGQKNVQFWFLCDFNQIVQEMFIFTRECICGLQSIHDWKFPMNRKVRSRCMILSMDRSVSALWCVYIGSGRFWNMIPVPIPIICKKVTLGMRQRPRLRQSHNDSELIPTYRYRYRCHIGYITHLSRSQSEAWPRSTVTTSEHYYWAQFHSNQSWPRS